VRVALAEDSTIFRNSLTLLLDAMGIDVVLAVGDGPALIAGIAGDPPDTVVLDARMPPSGDQEGFRVAERVHRLYPQVGILLFSNYKFHTYARRLLEQVPAGVGYLVKDSVSDNGVLADAIRRVAAGEVVLDDVIAQRISDAAPQDLSSTEREVLRHVASGLQNRAVAELMFIAEVAVERHLTSIFRKMNLPLEAGYNRRVLAILRWLDAQRI
jgi:DNA-binding NarL/FixJ family response regulator